MTQHSSLVGVAGVKFSPLKQESGLWVAKKIYEFPYAINMKVEPEQSTEKQYADNKLVDMVVSTGSTKVEMEMRDLPHEISIMLLGLEEENGMLLYKKNNIPPWVAMSFYGVKANGRKRYVGLVQGRFSIPGTDVKTKEEKVDFQTAKLSGEFLDREQDELYKVVADEDTEGFDLDKFYKKVYGDAYQSAEKISADLGKGA
ncbi:phage tail protein [Bacillus pumilus]|uniref:major tail protein n=1 Tax=Bacillus safensis TaxID=561879 RepID=UPI00383882AB|nr:phage tail protein [Bacillus pumilus]